MFITQPTHLELDLPSMLYGFLGPWRSKHRKPLCFLPRRESQSVESGRTRARWSLEGWKDKQRESEMMQPALITSPGSAENVHFLKEECKKGSRPRARHSQNGPGRPRTAWGVESSGDCSGPRLAERNTVNFRRGPEKHHLGKNPRASQTFFGGRLLTGCTLDLLHGSGFSLINRSEHQHLQKLVLFLVFTQQRVRQLFMRSVLLVPPYGTEHGMCQRMRA